MAVPTMHLVITACMTCDVHVQCVRRRNFGEFSVYSQAAAGSVGNADNDKRLLQSNHGSEVCVAEEDTG